MTKTFEKPLHATKHCRHYSYERGKTLRDFGGPKCALGLDLSEPGASFVCMPDKGDTQLPCPSREEYTEIERKAWQQAVVEGGLRLGAAIAAVPHPIPVRTSGTVACPNCDGGTLHFARWVGGAEIGCTTPLCCGAHFNVPGAKDWPAS